MESILCKVTGIEGEMKKMGSGDFNEALQKMADIEELQNEIKKIE